MTTANDSTRATILILDDDADSIAGFKMLLESDGYEVIHATNPFSAPFLIGRHNPDLVLLDLSMPALSGEQLLRTVGRRVFPTDAPLLLFSGTETRELARLCESLGADDYISKGEELDVALGRIDFWIRRSIDSEAERTLLGLEAR